MSIETNFVPYQIALDMKSIGFDDPCLGWYNNDTLRIDVNANQTIKFHKHIGRFNGCVLAPTFSQAFIFFREKYGLFSAVNVDQTMEPKFAYCVSRYCKVALSWDTIVFNSDLYYEYEKAELECLLKMIDFVKQK
jgi:hypothetical protein